ncbi:MAG: 6-carboxytetrahydropterin synthase [Methanobrevibacter sp.]|jgi:6-pyruvoyltetrahydropterin/6-carboxytetrahydropterin synthase|nr:6-carboxytetrahydropterin synthase [Candidatus Methanovirga aequatorialis]
MKIVVNGINANLRFSSAHIIPTHGLCGHIHGHSYFVDVEIEGEQSGNFDFIVDFIDVKDSVRKVCRELDHRILIPIFNKKIKFKSSNHENVDMDFFKNKEYLEFSIEDKEYKIPKVDSVILPLKHSSAEELAKYFSDKISNDILSKGGDIESITIGVNEGIGQGAFFKKSL